VSHDGTALSGLSIIVSPITKKLSRLQSQDNELKITFRVIRRSQHRSRDEPVECTLLRKADRSAKYRLEITDTCWELEHFDRAKWVTFRAISGVSIMLHKPELQHAGKRFFLAISGRTYCKTVVLISRHYSKPYSSQTMAYFSHESIKQTIYKPFQKKRCCNIRRHCVQYKPTQAS
jgi:hypothetical protein